MMAANMGDGLVAVIALGVIAGGAIVVIDLLILRRIRRQRQDEASDEKS